MSSCARKAAGVLWTKRRRREVGGDSGPKVELAEGDVVAGRRGCAGPTSCRAVFQ